MDKHWIPYGYEWPLQARRGCQPIGLTEEVPVFEYYYTNNVKNGLRT